jgi:mRNA interferase MazF
LADPYCPEAGEIVWINFNPQAGNEQANRRPALVLSPRRYNSAAKLCVVCPITNQVKGYPFEVGIPDGGPASGVVLADQVKSLSWVARNTAFICEAPPEVVAEALAKVKALLNVP